MMADQVPHGEYSGYQYHQCRCQPCTTAYSAYVNTRRRLILYGRWNPHGDLDAVRAHVELLGAGGCQPRQVDRAAGVWDGCSLRVLRDPSYQISRGNADRILAVVLNPRGLPQRRPFGAMNRLRCLAAIGHGLPWAAEHTGVTVRGLSYVRSGHRTLVDVRVHDAVVDLYREWSDHPAPETAATRRVRTVALANGWGPPAAWDDHWLDLSPGELEAELGREVARMDGAELNRNYRAVREEGELSPLVVAAAREHNRRRTLAGQELGRVAA